MDIAQSQLFKTHKGETEQVPNSLLFLVGLSEHDKQLLQDVVDQTRLWADEIVTEFYDVLFSHESTATIFHEGERPQRENTLRQWYLHVSSGNYDTHFWEQQRQIGLTHVTRQVKNPFTLGIMSRVQQLFLKKCLQTFEPTRAEQVYHAFKRVTDVAQGLIAEAYHLGYTRKEKLANDLQQIILPLSIAMSSEQDYDRLLERFLLDAKLICNADAATLYLPTSDNSLRFAIMRTDGLDLALGGTTGKEIPFSPLPLYDETGEPNQRNIATSVALQGTSINIPDLYTTEEFDVSSLKEFDRETGYRSISCLTVPLKDHNGKVNGVLQMFNATDATGQVVPFDAYHSMVVESLGSQAAMAINTRTLVQHEKSLLKFERDVQIGRQIQLDFLPKPEHLPQVPGWEIATYFHAAREVAGDFFDAFPIQNKIGLVIADVCDKGVGAALFMSLSRSLIRAFAEQHQPLGWLDDLTDGRPVAASNIDTQRRRKLLSAGTSALLAVERTNNYIAYNHGDMMMFATLFFGVLDPATGMLTYINGGHPPAVVVDSSGEIKARLPATGPAVGMMPDASFDIQQVKLEPGDTLFSFSDGVTDARNPAGKFFGEKGILPLLVEPASSASALLARFETALRNHIDTADQFDDITMLAVRREPPSGH